MYTGVHKIIKFVLYIGALAILSLVSFFLGNTKSNISNGIWGVDSVNADHSGCTDSCSSCSTGDGSSGEGEGEGEGGGGCSGGE